MMVIFVAVRQLLWKVNKVRDLIPSIRITWPTLLTIARIVLVPVIVVCVFFQIWGYAAILFAIAMATDFFDGFLARAFHLTTRFGALLDAFADKLMMLSLFVSFLFVPSLLPRFFIWLALAKELIVLFAAFSLLKRRYMIIVVPLLLGKITMAAEMFLVFLMLLSHGFALPFYSLLVNLVSGLIICTLIAYLSMVVGMIRGRIS